MGQRALGRGELDNAQHEGGHRREGMNGDLRNRIEQRRQTHGELPDVDRQSKPEFMCRCRLIVSFEINTAAQRIM